MVGRVVAGVAFVVAAACGILVLTRAGQPVYGVPDWGVAVTAGLLAVAVAGAALLAASRASGDAGWVLLGVALAVLGVLAILSVGLLLLAAGAVFLARSSCRLPSDGRAAAGAILVGAALPVLVVFAFSGPLVDCESGSSGESVFMGFAGGSGETTASVSDSPDGDSSGRARGEDYEYAYRCRGDELVSFTLRWRQ